MAIKIVEGKFEPLTLGVFPYPLKDAIVSTVLKNTSLDLIDVNDLKTSY